MENQILKAIKHIKYVSKKYWPIKFLIIYEIMEHQIMIMIRK